MVDTAIFMWIALVSGIMEEHLTIRNAQATGIVITEAITRDTGMGIMTVTSHYHIPTGRILTGIGRTMGTTTTIPDLITMRRVLIIVGHAGHNTFASKRWLNLKDLTSVFLHASLNVL